MKKSVLTTILITLFKLLIAQPNTKAADSLLLEYYQTQRFSEAADYLKKTHPEPVSDVKILSGLAYASQMAGRLPDADGYYQRIYDADTTNIAALFNLGSINARRGNDVKAIGYYKKILLKDSTNFNVLKQMGTLSQNAGDIPGAIKYLHQANKINPVEPDVAYDLATFYLNFKFYKNADTVVDIALKADTGNLLLLFAKAQTVYRLEQYPETVEVCNKLIKSGDQISVVINMLGTSYFHLNQYVNSINTFKILEQNQTPSETSYYYTAMSYKALKDQKMAIVYFDKAIKEAVSPNACSYYSEIGDSYDKIHQLKKSVNAYEKSLLYGVKPITYYALANMYDTELRNRKQALQNYRKYLKSNPPQEQQSYVAYAKRRMVELTH
ncbi:tetratricopeptide repeat protein [Mucilaginibacter frigoritolerans]|uniref:Tetratricopeptide repeat protein n=1 Tax=Mucilaginibacter frigoritolerans TaxID=652788 RepID=A0A562U5T0_9SPHI|nr:tetratricopeptide repeat protein [Mucilaginibacter frigoritolerans]TWJ00687.1 tetratricopeptide repeat protein [Mucilaginibacter frigoritolerans]